jgi:hypothetical protein
MHQLANAQTIEQTDTLQPQARSGSLRGVFITTIGIARATTKIGMANLVYNIKRFVSLR